MRTSISFFIAVILIVSTMCSCKKSSGGNNMTNNFPTAVSNIISSDEIASLRQHGMTINAGTTPPIVNGIYYMHPDSCTFDNSGNHSTGLIFADYKFRFSNQNNNDYSIDLDLKDVTNFTDSASDHTNTYISGSGNKFTIYAQINGVLSGVNYVEIELCSGELTAAGIQNFGFAFFLKSKTGDDTNATVAPVGTTRIFATATPGLATNSATYAIDPLLHVAPVHIDNLQKELKSFHEFLTAN